MFLFQTSKKGFHLFHDIMPMQLIRKLSFRKNSDKDISRKCSAKETSPSLPTEVLFRIIDHSDLIEQIRLRALNTSARDYVNKKINQVLRHQERSFMQVKNLEVRKADIDEASTSDWSHAGKAQVALRVKGKKAEIVVDSKWTNRDIISVVGMMSVFRETIEEATIDAPIAELLVVSISAMDLNRWYAFQCYMKAMDIFDADIHLECDFSKPGQVYWPSVQFLTIRTTEKQACHLARVIDYGVQCNWVLDRQMLECLRIEFTDLISSSRSIRRHLYHFRCWAGSAGFDHRFEQHFQKFNSTEVEVLI